MKTLGDDGAGTLLATQPMPPALPPVRRPTVRKVFGGILPRSEVRKEYRRKEFERAEESSSLAIAYPQLKSLKVDLLYFDNHLVPQGHGLKYRANLDAAKSVLQYNCPSTLCHRGGFNLSEELSAAVAGRQKVIEGKMHCQGSRDVDAGGTVCCKSILHFKMNLAFKTKAGLRRDTA